MKHSTHFIASLIAGIVFWQALWFFELSWFWFLTLLPAFVLLQINATNRYSFRDSLALEEIPLTGYESRLDVLEQNQALLEESGFIKFDEFYLPISTDVVIYAYRHETEPIYLCDYHIGKFNCTDIITRFNGAVALTTVNAENAGVIPRPPEKLLQNFVRLPLPHLIQQHREAISFVESRGFKTQMPPQYAFRQDFLADYMKCAPLARNFFFGAKVIYWMAVDRGKEHACSIRQQRQNGGAKILAEKSFNNHFGN